MECRNWTLSSGCRDVIVQVLLPSPTGASLSRAAELRLMGLLDTSYQIV